MTRRDVAVKCIPIKRTPSPLQSAHVQMYVCTLRSAYLWHYPLVAISTLLLMYSNNLHTYHTWGCKVHKAPHHSLETSSVSNQDRRGKQKASNESSCSAWMPSPSLSPPAPPHHCCFRPPLPRLTHPGTSNAATSV